MKGGYDDGYRSVPCFWGRQHGSLIERLISVTNVAGASVLDAGCGEGKNAAFLRDRGARVLAVDVSDVAIAKARTLWAGDGIEWNVADVTELEIRAEAFDVVVAYGLLHCLPSPDVVHRTLARLQRGTKPGGFLVVCAFNGRRQELERAHPGFSPTLLAHDDYLAAFAGWEICHASDLDLIETHPNNDIEHVHSMTRILARRA